MASGQKRAPGSLPGTGTQPARWVGYGVAACLSLTSAMAATNELSGAEIEGRNIVQHLLSQRPAENFTNSATLRIRDAKRQRTEVQVALQTFLTETNWQALYFTRGTNKDHAASLTVIHTENRPNEYRLADFSRPAGDTNEFVTLRGPQAMIPFAGSDFWLADLGLEFLHWPDQRLLKKELKRGQSCYVLESRNPGRESRVESREPNAPSTLDPRPSTTEYIRVVSWLDIDSVRDAGQAAIVLAEAYDAKGKLVKEFEPKGITKVRGQWQLQEMEIRNAKTGSRTSIKFKFDSE